MGRMFWGSRACARAPAHAHTRSCTRARARAPARRAAIPRSIRPIRPRVKNHLWFRRLPGDGLYSACVPYPSHPSPSHSGWEASNDRRAPRRAQGARHRAARQWRDAPGSRLEAGVLRGDPREAPRQQAGDPRTPTARGGRCRGELRARGARLGRAVRRSASRSRAATARSSRASPRTSFAKAPSRAPFRIRPRRHRDRDGRRARGTRASCGSKLARPWVEKEEPRLSPRSRLGATSHTLGR